VISGGSGHDTLKFIINDQNANAESALIAEFLRIESAFDLAARHGHAGSFEIDGLHVTGIERTSNCKSTRSRPIRIRRISSRMISLWPTAVAAR